MNKLQAQRDELLEALELMLKMWNKFADRIEWGKTFLDADTISCMNETLVLVPRVIAKVKREANG